MDYEKDIFDKVVDGVEPVGKRMKRLLRKHEAAALPETCQDSWTDKRVKNSFGV